MNLIEESTNLLAKHIAEAIEGLPPVEITTDPVRAGNHTAAGKIVILYGAPSIELEGNAFELTYKLAIVSPFDESRPEAISAIGEYVICLMKHLGISTSDPATITGSQNDGHPAYQLEYTHQLIQEKI